MTLILILKDTFFPRFMATGETFRSLAFAFRILHSYISTLVKETLLSMCKHLLPMFIPVPSTDVLKRNAEEFWQRWNFPNCYGAPDGKHIRIFASAKTGSLYSNYKEYFSIIMLALVDGNYKFVVLDVDSYGKESDSFHKTALGIKILTSEDFSQKINFNRIQPKNCSMYNIFFY